MGVQFRLVIWSPDRLTAKKAAQAAFAEIARLEAIVSDWDQNSELRRREALPPSQRPAPSKELEEIERLSEAMRQETKGLFDHRLGALTRLRRHCQSLGRTPTDAEWALAARKDERDYGGIAKGWAADRAGRVLRRFGIEAFLVDASGDLLLGAPPPDTQGWRVKVLPSKEIQWLSRCAVATSGDAIQDHLIDPHRLTSDIQAPIATVIAETAARADALATAKSVRSARK